MKLSCKKLNVWYGQKQILFNVTLQVNANHITALIGPSGCGKSTLLRCANRMNDLIPSARIAGAIHYDGEDISATDATDLRKRIGMVFQKPNPFPMSIFENVAYGLRVQGVKERGRLRRAVGESLKRADLWNEVKDRLDSSAFSLSGGQQQRLCIARALAIKPDVLLLDEPCSALDPLSTARIEELLVKLKREMTLIIVTHNMHQAKRISDRSCYLLNGKVIEYGPTTQVFGQPKNKLTKEYINGEFG